MKLSELIERLEYIHRRYGDLPVYHQHDGGENAPKVDVMRTYWEPEDDDANLTEHSAGLRVIVH